MEKELKLNLSTLAKRFADESEAWKLVERIRWPEGPVCPHCGNEDRVYFLQPKNGERRTRTGKVSHRRLWKCGACRKQFSVLVGTIFEDSKIPLSKWLLAIYMMASAKNGVAAYELHRTLGITNKSAWFMAHRIRHAMSRPALTEPMQGTVVADETFFGGKPGNRHRQGQVPHSGTSGYLSRTDIPEKVPILSLIHRETGEVRSRVLPNVTGATLGKALAEQIDMPASTLYTDAAVAYRKVGEAFLSHQTVDHSAYEYVRGNVSTNKAENFFSQLKRSIDGTHHHVSNVHLPRYLAEFDFRYTTRKLSDSERMQLTIRRGEGRRLTYR